jgi:hypothetical protein
MKVKKTELRALNHNKYDIVQYNNSFYRIKDIVVNTTNSNSLMERMINKTPLYELEEFKNKSNKITANSNDPDIVSIPKHYQ